MHYLLATASVHVTAAACDALEGSLDADDTVTVLGVVEDADDGTSSPAPRTPGRSDETAGRDLEDALNVARTRLAGAGVGIERREGVPEEVIVDVAREIGADRIVMGVNRGTAGATGLGGTTASVLVGAPVPVTVVPVAPA